MADKPVGMSGLSREKTPGNRNQYSRAQAEAAPEKQNQKHHGGKELFTVFSTRMARLTGSSRAFICMFSIVAIWLITGPLFHFSDTWQLVINTGASIVTFLMVFLIQNTQNRDSEALHLKLDALLLINPQAKNALIALEDLPQEDLEAFKQKLTDFAGGNKEQIQQALDEEEAVSERSKENRTSVGEFPMLQKSLKAGPVQANPLPECG